MLEHVYVCACADTIPSVRTSVSAWLCASVRACGCENVHISIPIHLCLSPKGGARASVHAEVNTNEYACKRTCARLHVRLLSDLGTSGLGCLYAHSHTRTHARLHRAMHRQTYGRTVWYLRMRKHTHAQACM